MVIGMATMTGARMLARSFGEMLVAMLAAGFSWLAGLWLGGHPLIGELRSLWVQVRRWA